ncbi:MAG: hypothetical protein RR672_07460, partial [Raoultibacter sp.]
MGDNSPQATGNAYEVIGVKVALIPVGKHDDTAWWDGSSARLFPRDMMLHFPAIVSSRLIAESLYLDLY